MADRERDAELLRVFKQDLIGVVGVYGQRDNADLYKDGYINIIDAVVMRGYLLGEYKTLPIYPESFSG